MKTGMLWFDDDEKRPLLEKLERACNRYLEKYGHSPNLVYVHPSMSEQTGNVILGEREKQVITLKHARSILPNHFWLGIESR